jgi:hypothetical protein
VFDITVRTTGTQVQSFSHDSGTVNSVRHDCQHCRYLGTKFQPCLRHTVFAIAFSVAGTYRYKVSAMS